MQNGLKSILDLNDKLKSNKDSSRPTLRQRLKIKTQMSKPNRNFPRNSSIQDVSQIKHATLNSSKRQTVGNSQNTSNQNSQRKTSMQRRLVSSRSQL